LNGTHKFLVYADDVNLFGEKINTLQGNMKAVLHTGRSRSKRKEI